MKLFYKLWGWRFRNARIALTITRFPAPRTPFDTGAADKYYGRPRNPSFADFWGRIRRDLTDEQFLDYLAGYEAEIGSKDWGGEGTD